MDSCACPLVTIGLPVFNGERFLAKTIESLLLQDYPNLAILISDNGSTDSTETICRSYAASDDRIQYFRNSTNEGPLRNSQKIMHFCSSDFIMWASDHDLWHPTYVSRLMIELLADESVVLAYPRTVIIDVNDEVIEYAPDILDTRGLERVERFSKIIWNFTWGNMNFGVFRSAALKKIIREYSTIGMDHVQFAYLSLHGSIAQVDEFLFFRRRNRPDEDGDGLIRRQIEWFVDSRVKALVPWTMLAFDQIRVVKDSDLSSLDKELLFEDIRNCYNFRFGNSLQEEEDNFLPRARKILESQQPLAQFISRIEVSEIVQICAFFHPKSQIIVEKTATTETLHLPNLSSTRLYEKENSSASDNTFNFDGFISTARNSIDAINTSITVGANQTGKIRHALKIYAGDVPDKPEYCGWLGLSLTQENDHHLRHDITRPLTFADNSVDAFQSEDVFEHIAYEQIIPILNEIYRVLKPGACFRLSVPDYRCDVLDARTEKDETGTPVFDPGGGGTRDNPGHVWFPRYETVKALVEKSLFGTEGKISFLHYYDERNLPVTKEIDYSRGYIQRTPDHDPRVQSPYRPMSLVVDLIKADGCPRENADPAFGTSLTEQTDGAVRFSFVMIVLNGMPLVEYALRAIYAEAHEIIVVEGAVEKCLFAATPDGSSVDGTVECVKGFPDPAGKIRLIQGTWKEKCEMQNAALRHVTGTHVWLVDSDEIYRREDIPEIRELLASDPDISQVNFIPDNFWKGFDHLFVSPHFFEPVHHYRRLFKFVPGASFTSHRPPTMVWPGSNITTEQRKLVDGTTTRGMGIFPYHYSYVFDSQVEQKIELYRRYGWGEGWGVDLEKWYREFFLEWTPERRLELERRFPIWTGDPYSYSTLFRGDHPEVMTDLIAAVKQGAVTLHDCRNEPAEAQNPPGTAEQEEPGAPNRGIKVAGEGVTDKDLTQIQEGSEFETSLRELILSVRPLSIIETGTYLGTGTTRIIASALRDAGLRNTAFFSIECNPLHHQQALFNLGQAGLLPHVRPLLGLSVPRSILPTLETIHEDTVNNPGGDGIYVDHQEADRVALYHRETDFPGIPEDLLGACLRETEHRPDIVLLDSGGHMGNAEFNYLIGQLQGECHVVLDDIKHIKHHRSFRQMQADPRFSIIRTSDEKFGFCIAKFTPLPDTTEDIKSILWLRTDSIGDNILASSMLPFVKDKYGDARITVVCQQHIAELYQNCPMVDDIITIPSEHAWKDNSEYTSFLDRVRSLNPDLLLNSTYSVHGISDLPGLEFIPARIAFRQAPHASYTRLAPSQQSWKLELERHRDFLEALSIKTDRLAPMIWLSDREESSAEEFYSSNNLIAERSIILFPGARTFHRHYSPDKYAEALSTLPEARHFSYLVLGSDGDHPVCEELTSRLLDSGLTAINMAGKTSILQMAALIKKARLYVGTETAAAHIACAVGTPNVVLLGGGHFGRFMPYSPLTSAVCLPLECFCCDWECRYARVHCIRDILPEVITDAIHATLTTPSDRPRLFVHGQDHWRPEPSQPAWNIPPGMSSSAFTIVTHEGTSTDGKSSPGSAIRLSSHPRSEWPKISLVTPSFNQGEYLEECIDSILSQNYPNLEYIVMDGGSTDNSIEIIKKYERHLTYWQSCPDGGQYQAINEGFRRATGEIFGWLNSDDKLHAGSLSLIARIFSSFSEIDWITGRPTAWDKEGNLDLVFDYLPSWSQGKYLNREFSETFIQQESTFWRRSLWEKAGSSLQTDLKYAADFELWARFFRHAQLHTVDALLGGFRYHGAQKTASFMEDYLREAHTVIDRENMERAGSASSPPLPAPLPITIADLAVRAEERITAENFSTFTYSQFPHFAYFGDNDLALYGRKIDMRNCDLKSYQDLLVCTFIRDNIPPGARILEVGGGDSRVLKALHSRYECWNIDKLEGVGNGLTTLETGGYRLIRDYMGTFSNELPDGYFDLVFSISALEHVPEDEATYGDICRDIDRVMAPGAFSLHCFDIVITPTGPWSNGLLYHIFDRITTINQFVPLAHLAQDPNTFYLSEEAYESGWAPLTRKSYREFGKPLSCNVLWRKADAPPKEHFSPPPVTIATSIAPANIPGQQQAIASWEKLGFQVISVNSAEEISVIRESFPNVTFVEAHRNAAAITGKPLVYFDDILQALDECKSDICGIINADIHLRTEGDFIEFICRESENSFIFGSRIEIDSLDHLDGDVYPLGFDFFFLDRKLLGQYPPSSFCLGAPWWDYWAPLVPLAQGASVKLLKTPVAYHLRHTTNWAQELWEYYGRQYFASLADSRLTGQSDSLASKLGRSAAAADAHAFAVEVLEQLKENAQVLYLPVSGPAAGSFSTSPSCSNEEINSMASNIKGGLPEEERAAANRIYQDVFPLITAGKTDEAISALEKLITSHPHFALAHNDLGVLCGNMGETEKALAHYEKAVYLDPTNTTFQKNLADFNHVVLGRTEEALQIYVRILAAQPKDVETLLAMGNLCISVDKLDDADYFFTRALELEPWNQEARESLEALRNFRMNRPAPDEPAPETAEEIYRHAQELAGAGRIDEATAALERLLQQYPHVALAHNDLGVLHGSRGDTEKALVHYEKAVYLDPTNTTFQKNLADFRHAVLGETEEALQIYVRILAAQPKDVETLLALGNLCISVDKLDDADYFFTRALEVEPWNSGARESLAALRNHQTATPLPFPSPEGTSSLEGRPPAGTPGEYLVSAIVSTYNAEKFLQGCLENLETQTIADRLEIIVVDSGSQENEQAIVREFQGRYPNIRYIRTDKRETVYQAWNRGIRAASGRYITNANTDDRHRADALEKLASALDQNPDVELAYADIFISYDADTPFDTAMRAETVKRPDFSADIMLTGCHMGPQPMWRASVHDRAGYFNESYISAGDYEFWCRMALAHDMKMYHLPEVLGCYYFNRNGVEISNLELSGSETERIKESYACFLAKKGCSSSSPQQPVDIIFLTYNRLAYFHQTIAALVRNTRYPYRLIIVDNRSDDEFRRYLQQSSIIYDHLVLNDDNYFTAAFQRGIELATSDPYVVSDPDILVPDLEGKCWLERLMDLHRDYPEMGLIALNLDPANKPAQLPEVYLGEKTVYNEEITLANAGTVMQSIKRRFFDGRYTTDWEACEQIRKNGGKVGYATRILACHLGWNEDKDYPDYLVGKYRLFQDKFKSDIYSMYTDDPALLARMGEEVPAYYSFSRPEVQELVSPSSRRILDVGCAAGNLGGELKARLGAEVWGIEYVEKAAAQAATRLDKVLTGPVEELLPQLPDNYFDTIICADVLEHLVDPQSVLSALRAKLAAGGEVVASIPNVRHWSVLKGLLEGRWDYRDEGVLDRTHLRFFTRKNILELFEQSGYQPTTMNATTLNNVELPAKVLQALSGSGLDVSSLADESNHYQYLLRARVAAPSSPGKKPGTASPAAKPAKASKPAVSATAPVSAKVQPLTSIIILTFNQLQYTKECVESIRRHTPDPHEIIFVDNGSTDGTVKWLRQQVKTNKQCRLIENKKNRGFAKGCNQGIKAAKGEYLLLLNNDVVVTEGWLTGMQECLAASPECAIVGPMTNNIAGPQQLPSVPYCSMEEMDRFAGEFRQRHRHRRIPVKLVVGFCLLFGRDLVEKIGTLDESFAIGNYEDDDLCLRASLAGLGTVIAGDVFVHHYGNRSFQGNNIDFTATMAKNRAVFDRKWDLKALEQTDAFRLATHHALIRAAESFQKGDLDQAVETLIQEGIKFSPGDARPYLHLAQMLIDVKRFSDALQIIREMPGTGQTSASLVLEGICHEGLEEFAAAADCAARALALNPVSAPALNLQGVLAFQAEDRDGAAQHFQQALAIDPGIGEAHTNLGVIRWAEGAHDEALGLLEKGFILAPSAADPIERYHAAICATEEYSRGEQAFREARALFPDSRVIAFKLIDMLLRQERHAEAMAEIEQAILSFGADDGIIDAALQVRQLLGQENIGQDTGGKNSLSLCMIAKNEAAHLARALASVKPLVSEMIVVDTGSSDRTRDIATAFGATVHDFPWTGSFAEARNFSLEKATGNWILVVDADEVIAPQDYQLLRELVDRGDQRVAYSLCQKNYTDLTNTKGWQPHDGKYSTEEAGTGFQPNHIVRLFPNDSRVRFENPVHELVEPSLRQAGIPILKQDIAIHHYGKLDKDRLRAKWEMYYELGKRKLEDNQGDTKALTELAIQAAELGKYDEALELWQQVIALDPESVQAHFNSGYAYLCKGEYQKALQSSQKAMELDPELKEALFNYACCELYVGDLENIAGLLEQLLKKHPDYPSAIALLSSVYFCQGDTQKGQASLEQVRKMNYDCGDFLCHHAKVLLSQERIGFASRLLEAAIDNGFCSPELTGLLQECEKRKI